MKSLLAALLLMIAMTVAVLAACSPANEEAGEHGEGGESGEHNGESESGEGDGEESATQYGLTDTYDVVRAGARLMLSYDATANAFTGTVENTTNRTLRRVRIEVHLSNGIELGPTPPLDLTPGQMTDVRLDASQEPFETWSAHPEVGGDDEQTSASAPGDIEAAARELLADEDGVDKGALTLVSSESVSWPDASLGCPQEGFGYAQVITPGYKFVFTLGDTSYAVHTNEDGSHLVHCDGGG